MKMSEMARDILIEGGENEGRRLLVKYQNALAQLGTAVSKSEMDTISQYVRELGDANDATIFLHQIELMREVIRKNLIICKKISSVSIQKEPDKKPVENLQHTPGQKDTIAKLQGILTKGL